MVLKGFPNNGVTYHRVNSINNIGEKPTVVTLYQVHFYHINHHVVGTPKQKQTTSYYTVCLDKSSRLRYSKNYIEKLS